mmetsp:Transcript_12045/g.28556  ORF Transcript_12045/g.28556 Transcript_12045/m.28556 type:complete len:923 (+) Transcript_12045:626-3394(+)
MVKSKRVSKKQLELENFVFKTMNPKADLRPELKEKIEKWIVSFYHLDPRYKILTFFNLVAAEGADNVTDDQVDEQKSYVNLGANKGIGNSNPAQISSLGYDNGGNHQDSANANESSSQSSSNRSANRDNYRANHNLYNRPSARHIRPSTLTLLSSLFNATSILTVWRPCSNDAMRKMMEGKGVGKGLDIKGKSAKKGSLSAYVPFMQIFNNDHKSEIQPIAECAEMRVYYSSIELRDFVYEFLKKFLEEGPPKKQKSTVGDYDISSDIIVEGEEDTDEPNAPQDQNGNNHDGDSLPPHKDPNSPAYLSSKCKLKKIKKFVKTGFYGIECSQRLFWYATIQDADISRVGTGTETGRPSLPPFQDGNLKTLKVAQSQLPKPTPMPVVLQHKSVDEIKRDLEKKKTEAKQDSDEENDAHSLDGCLDPRYLVMAYEEQGTIKPVVSDFDAFLLGWRREALWFGCNLPRDQEKLMMWCVDHIEEILEDQKRNPTNSDTWTVRWLDVKKKATAEGFNVELPEYGFGDPKSTSIMEHAALKLKSTGAVRHGSECFNYDFPQEIDDMFLLISDTLKPVPWKYVNVKDLQAILSDKIAEGFVFPLNPKWILCDPGWKKIYDDLMASDALYADLSKDVWFPPHNGIRERIEEIYKNHPNGFQRCTHPRPGPLSAANRSNTTGRRQSATNILRETLDEAASELTGNAFADLAQLELEDFKSRTSGDFNSNAKSDMKADMLTARLTIQELEDEDHSSSEARTVGSRDWRTPSKQSEKRPSFVSHSGSIGSRESDKYHAANCNRGVAMDGSKMGSSSHSSSSNSTSRPVRKLVKGVAQSTRKFFVPGKTAKKNRARYLGDTGSERDQEEEYESNFNNLAITIPERATNSQQINRNVATFPEQDILRPSTRSNPKPKTKTANSKWTKIRQSLKNQK